MRELTDNEEFAIKQAVANVRLEGLPVSDKFIAYLKHSLRAGKTTADIIEEMKSKDWPGWL